MVVQPPGVQVPGESALIESAAWAQIGSLAVSVLIAIFVHRAARRSTKSTESILQQTRELAHQSRRSDLIREISEARVEDHLASILREILSTFHGETLLLRIYYANPGAGLPTANTRTHHIDDALVKGIHQDLDVRYEGRSLDWILGDLRGFAEVSRKFDDTDRYLIGSFVARRLCAIKEYELLHLGRFLTVANLDIAKPILSDLERVSEVLRPRVLWDICCAVVHEAERCDYLPEADRRRLFEDLAGFAYGVADSESELKSVHNWASNGLPGFTNELVFKFVQACAFCAPHSTNHIYANYVLPLCLHLLGAVPPLRGSELVPARVLEDAISRLEIAVIPALAERFVVEKTRILASDPEMGRRMF